MRTPPHDADERLRLVMTSIDARAPSRAFSFTVYVDSADRYHSVCLPHARLLR